MHSGGEGGGGWMRCFCDFDLNFSDTLPVAHLGRSNADQSNLLDFSIFLKSLSALILCC